MITILARGARAPRRGFALAETLVAITVLGILIGAAVPVTNKVVMYKARQATTAELQELREGAGAFFLDVEALPTSIAELLDDPGRSGWIGPYLPVGRTERYIDPSGFELDAWSRPYTLAASGDVLKIRSAGADGVSWTADDVTLDLDVTHIRRTKTLIRLERINRAVERYNAEHGATSPPPPDYTTLYSSLVEDGLLPSSPDYQTDAWGNAFVIQAPGAGPLVAVTSSAL